MHFWEYKYPPPLFLFSKLAILQQTFKKYTELKIYGFVHKGVFNPNYGYISKI